MKNIREDQLVKITIPLPKSDWHPYATETIWAEPLGNDRYKIQNSPFYAQNISYKDIVLALWNGDQLLIQQIILRGGHSTYRIYIIDNQMFGKYWKPLGKMGCTYEKATGHLYTVDVPPEAAIQKVYQALVDGEKANIWEFQEGHCGHQITN